MAVDSGQRNLRLSPDLTPPPGPGDRILTDTPPALDAEGQQGAVLRSIGSMLSALGGAAPAEPAPEVPDRPGPVSPPADERPTRSPMGTLPALVQSDPDDEIALVLAGARERAQQLIDQSVEQARAMLEERHAPGADIREFADRVEAALSDVYSQVGQHTASVEQRVVEMSRGVSGLAGRLDRLEALLHEMVDAARPRAEVEAGRQQAIAPPAEGPLALSGGVVAAPSEPDPGATRFDPGAGALSLRVSPIGGFQGLMRVQSALSRVDTIGQATVETYQRGEARLRLELTGPIAGADLATAIEALFGQPAFVRDASADERSILIVVE